jgi:hypothetical protein
MDRENFIRESPELNVNTKSFPVIFAKDATMELRSPFLILLEQR